MTVLNRIWDLFEIRMETPPSYGWFHILWCVLSVVAGVLLCIWLKDGRRYAPRVVFVTAVIVAGLECYKLLHFGLLQGGGTFAFPWKYFPFQFCSTPMYAGLLVGVFRKGRFHDSLCAYLATFAVFAGLCVMIYPAGVLVRTVGINIQTMICHGSMITVGIYLFGSGYVSTRRKTVMKAVPLFLVAVVVAMVLNEWAYRVGIEGFNMFYFSPYAEPHLVVFSDIQRALGVSNPLNIVIYVTGFTLAAYVMLLFAVFFRWLASCVRRIKWKSRSVCLSVDTETGGSSSQTEA